MAPMAPSQTAMEAMKRGAEGQPPTEIRRIIADQAPPTAVILRDLVRKQIWNVFEELLNIAELAGQDQYHWMVCRRQMLKSMNDGDVALRAYINELVGLPTETPLIETNERKGTQP